MMMEQASLSDKKEIMELYEAVIDRVNRSSVRLGWNIEIYPNEVFVEDAIGRGEMFIMRCDGKMIAAAAVNHTVNPEYDDIDWSVKGPSSKIATIHALAVVPSMQGTHASDRMLTSIESYCRRQGDLAIHLDVIDTNIPAYKLYMRNGYTEVDRIMMFYDVVGTREFWMLEHVL